ncbi:MAG: IS1634 family transposase [Planctomycetota bacterium]
MLKELIRLIRTEPIDDIPILLAYLRKMQVIALLDEFFPTHGHWKGELSLGEVVAVWLSFVVSQGDHRLAQVEPWAEQRLGLLSTCLGKSVRALDFSDDRLADILDALSDGPAWRDFETRFSQGLVRVYELPVEQIRLDSTSAKTYAGVSPEGLFQFGHSKDHRPDLPQVKLNLSTLDPLGLPLTTSVVSGQTADDPLYVPEIKRVQACFGPGGKTYIGDCKMAALATRAYVAQSQDYYLCPLSSIHLSDEALDMLLQPVLRDPSQLTPVYAPLEVGATRRQRIAEGFEIEVALASQSEGQAVAWTERRLVVHSLSWAKQQEKALEKRLALAVDEVQALTERRQGKKRLSASDLQPAAEAILARRKVTGLVKIQITSRTTAVSKRRYAERPAEVQLGTDSQLKVKVDRTAVEKAKLHLGWRVYATNHPTLTMTQLVLAYREQYLLERCFGRLKGATLSLTPLYLQTDTRVTGLIRLLTIAVRLLTLVEFSVRQKLKSEQSQVAGLSAGNPKRATALPTAELLLKAFKGLSLTVFEIEGQTQVLLSELTALQVRLLDLLGLSVDVYQRLNQYFLKPALSLSEP